MGEEPPRAARAHQVAQGVVNLAQRMLALRRIFPHQAKIRRNKPPIFVRNIAGIAFAVQHPRTYSPNDKS